MGPNWDINPIELNDRIWGPGNWIACPQCPRDGRGNLTYHHRSFHVDPPPGSWLARGSRVMKGKRILVTGAGGAIGGHLVKRLLQDGNRVIALDMKAFDKWWQLDPNAENVRGTCAASELVVPLVSRVDGIFHLAANMGGIGFISTAHALCMESTAADITMIQAAYAYGVEFFFYSSSACAYPTFRQEQTDSVALSESMAWPAMPDGGYGLQKLYTERLLDYYRDEHGLPVRIARFFNVVGPHGAWTGGREKAPAALARKVAEAKIHGYHRIEVWGDGEQTRSFIDVRDCVDGSIRLAESDCYEPTNLGSVELVSIDSLVHMISEAADWGVEIDHVPGPQGVRGRIPDNTKCWDRLGWAPSRSLKESLQNLYPWVEEQVRASL